ncbi:MAG: sn-glycerol-3-phosphate ABC transporter ATP-binding protein UgpC [Candidatus Eisenbacteria bacterium]|uniref:sn-glycerol-3-phosphate ABC transporter ATP-binding protein UgpC n=1 Tax=Eiseniibacteriota bacterium TaxID=2212470 RepID=A0A849SBM4_UNCEI|nr:sn-glycerol-3-phosphate ABC transporter ATP-binding protein UgpC [Candidatus Eisenbacteria bacterium]
MPSVSLRDVTKTYGRGTYAVDHVSFEIADGEFLVLVGPSGCGKSTLLRMIAGLEDISAGEIRIGERVVNEVEPKDRDVAMVFQNYALYPHMSVHDNMAFGLRRRKLPEPEVERRVKQSAELLGLTGYLQRRPRELSGGERQRVALGRAMVREPKVFLYDEPLSNLDAKLRVHMRAELKRIHARARTTTVYVTHDQVEAMTLGERIAVMRKGVLQQIADPFTLYNRPTNQFVAGFIGSPPINFVATRAAADGRSLEAEGIRFPLSAALAARVEPLNGREVTLGVRPENLVLSPTGDGISIPARVEVSEPLGNEVLVHWATSVGELISRVPGQVSPTPGSNATLHAGYEHLHLFDAASEASLAALEPARA